MRSMGRTHGVGLSWITEEIKCGRVSIGYIITTDMAADIFTKFFTKEKKDIWAAVCRLICVFKPGGEVGAIGMAGKGHLTATARKVAQIDSFAQKARTVTVAAYYGE